MTASHMRSESQRRWLNSSVADGGTAVCLRGLELHSVGEARSDETRAPQSAARQRAPQRHAWSRGTSRPWEDELARHRRVCVSRASPKTLVSNCARARSIETASTAPDVAITVQAPFLARRAWRAWPELERPTTLGARGLAQQRHGGPLSRNELETHPKEGAQHADEAALDRLGVEFDGMHAGTCALLTPSACHQGRWRARSPVTYALTSVRPKRNSIAHSRPSKVLRAHRAWRTQHRRRHARSQCLQVWDRPTGLRQQPHVRSDACNVVGAGSRAQPRAVRDPKRKLRGSTTSPSTSTKPQPIPAVLFPRIVATPWSWRMTALSSAAEPVRPSTRTKACPAHVPRAMSASAALSRQTQDRSQRSACAVDFNVVNEATDASTRA